MMLRDRSSSGAALIVVLILSAIIYLAVTTIWLMTMTEISLSDFERRSIRAFYLAETAITMGVARLRTEPGNLTMFSDTVSEKLDVFSVAYTPKLYDEHESWYNLVLEGEGVISGPTASAKRRVLREIVQKPFVLFGEEIELRELCRIDGNIHGNQKVDIGANVKVEGHISSSLAEAIISEDAVIPEEETPALEPEMTFPLIPENIYSPKYFYEGGEYEAQTLSLTTSLSLSPDDEGHDPPVEILNIYRGKADPENNPAGVFVVNSAGLEDEAHNTLSVIDVEGSVILPASVPFLLKGLVRIEPLENFPALLSFGGGEVNLGLISFEEIKDFLDVSNPELAKLPQKNSIEGLLYSLGTIKLATESGSITIDGSIWADTIVLEGNATCAVDFSPRLFTNPPPGLKVVEQGEWRELIE